MKDITVVAICGVISLLLFFGYLMVHDITNSINGVAIRSDDWIEITKNLNITMDKVIESQKIQNQIVCENEASNVPIQI